MTRSFSAPRRLIKRLCARLRQGRRRIYQKKDTELVASDLALSIEIQGVFYALRRAGASSGGVISNALAVQQVMENAPTRATRATSSSVLKDASADA